MNPRTIFLLSFIVFFFLFSWCEGGRKGYDKGIKGMFVFGSSLVDNGNNNALENSRAKANYLPYGMDFPLGPSGRFTNGKNVIDFLGDYLGLPSSIPTFSDPSTKGMKIVHGVNYASGGSGILDNTGIVSGNVTTLNRQIKNFEEVTLPELRVLIRRRKSSLDNYLFVVGSGGNDYSFNYFLTNSDAQVSLPVFTANLTATLSGQLKKLYSLGARKMVVISVNPLGCSPMVRANNKGQCIETLNQAAQLFNLNLKTLVDVLKPQMPRSNLVFLNSYQIINDIISQPASKGFKEAAMPCCEVPSLSEGGNGVLCKNGGKTCPNRTNHVFFDALHPTEAVNELIASKAYGSQLQTEVYPTNVLHLANI
ncbi:GDSL esterase/lipase At4g16230-like [Cucurbita pepo subsp. pepo]|uniref:GDSL esterase/lipase At4g16230-like n=1 Tax=Cucurbita pepo subsp. pepo TaxID=3664 RepID=UPI000C9D4A6D|nr:GDSL esterase/lipase At4g16230-like [Cucurbita pepo subsp. pepo]